MNQPRDFSLHGAVDLGARQAAAQRRQRVAEQGSAAGSEPGAQSGFIIDVTDETFNTDVLARSRTVPVILDLWADWCGPCKQLSPILEKLATESNGAFVLAKVDVDANPQLSEALQVQSIPMVAVVIDGQLIPGFLGALPEAQVRQFLDQVMQAAEQLGMRPTPGTASQALPMGWPPAIRKNSRGRAATSSPRRRKRWNAVTWTPRLPPSRRYSPPVRAILSRPWAWARLT